MDAEPDARSNPMRAVWRAATTPWLVLVWGGCVLWMLMVAIEDLGRTRCYIPMCLRVFDVDGAIVVAEWGDDVSVALESAGHAYETAWYGTRSRQAGFLATMLIVRIEEIRCAVADPSSEASVRAAVFDYLRDAGYASSPLLRTRNIETSSVLWSGCAMNLTAIFVACAFWGSARRCFTRTMTTRQRRTASGECPNCRYAIAGLPTPVCPECGERLD